ncbi:MAG: PIN domain-containing protein [Ignavibacteriales bacterium]|nr:MAG: PIN domain-containing protein [Ignavibacteriales bacterium]
MVKAQEFLIETDILIEHLTHKTKATESTLEKFMQKGICYTSVINASELLFSVNNIEDRDSVIQLLNSLKVLGLNSRYSLSVPGLNKKVRTNRDALVYVLAKINKLKIVTLDNKKYKNVSDQVKVIIPKR